MHMNRPYWFRKWLVACSAPSHCPNQCWLIVNWTLGDRLKSNLNSNITIFIQYKIHEEMSSTSCRPFVLASMYWITHHGIRDGMLTNRYICMFYTLPFHGQTHARVDPDWCHIILMWSSHKRSSYKRKKSLHIGKLNHSNMDTFLWYFVL